MNKYLSLFLSNFVMIAWLYACYLYPEYDWSVKAVLYIFMPVGIVGGIYYTANPDQIQQKMKSKFMSLPWNIIDYIFDAVIIAMFICLDYRVIFTLYIINVLLSATMKLKTREIAKSTGGRP